MKKNMKSSSILLGGLFLLGAVCSCTQTAPDYASYVNPFIGTGLLIICFGYSICIFHPFL